MEKTSTQIYSSQNNPVTSKCKADHPAGNKVKILFALWILLLPGVPYQVKAQTQFNAKSVKAWIQGSSTLHDWSSDITTIEFKGQLQSEGNSLKSIRNVEVKIPVQSIKSKEGKMMDNKTYEAFNYEKNPYITYSFSQTKVKMDSSRNVTIDATGNLTMAGTTRQVSLTVKGKMLPNGDLQLSVSKPLKMTEFNMKPPSLMLGTIKVRDMVTVNFNFVISHTKP